MSPMATEISPVIKRKPRGFIALLSSAACEWLLMFLLFVDAAFAYLLTKFARYCELKPPCLLCSRFEKAFEKKPGYYWNLLCSDHREEISSLMSCSVHSKFADANGMCEECLLPLAMQNRSHNPESYRLLVGTSWVDVDRAVVQNLLLNKHIRVGSTERRTCSCCNKTWRTKSNADRLLHELNPVGLGASKANVKPPLPRAIGRTRFSRRDSLKRLRDKLTAPMTSQHQAEVSSKSGDSLSHVGYTKLKICSDSESEFPFSDDDDDKSIVSHCKNCSKLKDDVPHDGDHTTSEKQTQVRGGCEVKSVAVPEKQTQVQEPVAVPGKQTLVQGGGCAVKPVVVPEKQTQVQGDSEVKPVVVQAEVQGGSEMKPVIVQAEVQGGSEVKPVVVQGEVQGGFEVKPVVVLEKQTQVHGGFEVKPVVVLEKQTQVHGGFEVKPVVVQAEVQGGFEMKPVVVLEKQTQVQGNSEAKPVIVLPKQIEIQGGSEVKPVLAPEKQAQVQGSSEVKPDVIPEKQTEVRGSSEVKPILFLEKQTESQRGFEVKPILVKKPSLLDLSDRKNVMSPLTSEAIEQRLMELDWGESLSRSNSSLALDDGQQISDVAGGLFGALAGNSKSNGSLPHMGAISVLSELLSLCNVDSLPDTATIPKKTVNIEGTSGIGDASPAKHIRAVPRTSSDDPSPFECNNNMNQADPPPQSDETRKLSDKHAVEPINNNKNINNAHDSSKKERVEEMKPPPHVSGTEVGPTPVAPDKQNESRKTDEGSSSSLPELQISASLKRNDFSYESLDGLTVSEIEGESIVDRLMRQVEHDRNVIKSLYKDLEEERNAAAIAANHSMAMITRLQEEKAALHMEALQYLRMMEEQAEYDMEALERANELLAEREKELQDMEYELDFYKINFLDEERESVQHNHNNSSNNTQELENRTPKSPITSSSNSRAAAKPTIANGNFKPISISSVSNFEDEKLYISECLKKLEKKVDQAYLVGKQLDHDMPNGLDSDKIKVENLENGEKSGSASAKGGEISSAALKKDIAHLHERLEALEADRSFLWHVSDLLRNGKDGEQLVQDIAQQLQELRKINSKTAIDVAYLSVEK